MWAEKGNSRQPVGGPEGGTGPSGLLVDKEEEGGVWMGEEEESGQEGRGWREQGEKEEYRADRDESVRPKSLICN